MSTTAVLRTLRGRNVIAGAGALTTAVALGATLMAAAPAQADPHGPYGTVTARTGLIERQYPSTDSSVRGSLHFRQTVALKCKVRAQNIEGNTVWYLLRDRQVWVSARYMDNHGFVKYCKDVDRSSREMLNSVPKGAMG
ncbi:SH3 domain-containing protein [Streptomyces sp. NPDC090052]|uniref:SH3 domain-containing protein n=1 Tax=unclassified Streptomyces TaxID=2593676 RepID=UPI00224DC8BA|nr:MULTISPECIES: SH3 domain-containing protein [unclassified Streptomyces]MCX4722356.1 SH3 domain-containing protein [Streptomyces sp. NBC_01306]WSV07983.1 SH3 domain-containing protein [Streptomyces sp. NBC_01020]WSX46071.1 SH3 domain-containing protein [Streptomyces sp. NBC_00963]WSX65859.1 SH3 domain-containing protein [Streptomyces sp. NBC_00932]